ncbi:MAG: hypothetical protein HC850_08875 [Rhodomicrobium sp.]|nr:hypothetical protein [Rhodomicrobium sp.]
MKRIGVLTSGGDAPGMNAAIRAVVRTGAARGLEVIGVRRGYAGMMEGEFEPLGARSVANTVQRGGTILLTARCKAFYTPEGRAQGAAKLKEAGIEGLVVIGGDGPHGTGCGARGQGAATGGRDGRSPKLRLRYRGLTARGRHLLACG